MIVGNDISRWQGDVDFDVYKNNSHFLIVKSSEGVGFTDPKFPRNQSECRRVGLPLGYYHFARPDLKNDAEKEADWFLQVCGNPIEGEVYCLDYEANWDGDVVGWCKKFLDRVKNQIGVKPLIYLNQSLIRGHDWTPVVDGGYGLWVAAYTYDPRKNDFVTGAWKFAAIQQWTNQQQVPGIQGNVDGNVLFGNQQTFKEYGYQPPISAPETPPDASETGDEEETETGEGVTPPMADTTKNVSIPVFEEAKSFLASKTIWLAVAQVLVGIYLVFLQSEPELRVVGAGLLSKSGLDVLLRFKTDKAVTLK